MNDKKEEYEKYYDILELTPDATPNEVKKAYFFLKDLYSTKSIVTLPAEGEISEEQETEILDQIEEAYQKILTLFKEETQSQNLDLKQIVSEVEFFDGKALKEIREKLNIQLQDVAATTGVPLRHLENIEKENYDALPAYVYTRGFLVTYAKHMALAPDRVIRDYTEKYNLWKKEQEEKPVRVYQQTWL